MACGYHSTPAASFSPSLGEEVFVRCKLVKLAKCGVNTRTHLIDTLFSYHLTILILEETKTCGNPPLRRLAERGPLGRVPESD